MVVSPQHTPLVYIRLAGASVLAGGVSHASRQVTQLTRRGSIEIRVERDHLRVHSVTTLSPGEASLSASVKPRTPGDDDDDADDDVYAPDTLTPPGHRGCLCPIDRVPENNRSVWVSL